MTELALLNKYNVPVPRYTSYPTVPFWNENMHLSQWRKAFRDQFAFKWYRGYEFVYTSSVL